MTATAALKSELDVCPITGERQKVVAIQGGDEGLCVTTRGKSTAWLHTIKTEEVDPSDLDL